MSVTFKALFTKPVTMPYPHKEPELSGAYRSAIELIRFEETGTHDCVACLQCEQICPSFCIKIDGERPEGMKKKRATTFDMDFALCSLCGLCLDVCPTTTLKYSRLYDEAGYQREWVHDLLDDFRDGEEAYREVAAAEEAEKAAAREAKRAAAAEAKEKKAAAEAAAAAAAAEAAPAAETAPAAEAAPAAETAPAAEVAPAAETAPAAEAAEPVAAPATDAEEGEDS
jgi:NADH-quinone oxidoreductase subunit I